GRPRPLREAGRRGADAVHRRVQQVHAVRIRSLLRRDPQSRDQAGVTRASALALFAPLAATPVHSQDYPTRPIRVLVPAAAGGIGDILPRMLGAKLAES